MKTIFLCGPYNSPESELRLTRECVIGVKEYNSKVAIKAAQYLRKAGYNVFCPHVAIAGYCVDMDDSNIKDHYKIMEMCMQWISICDCMATIPGWEKSENCKAEFTRAASLNKMTIHLTYGQIGV